MTSSASRSCEKGHWCSLFDETVKNTSSDNDNLTQFVIFIPLSYCFEKAIGFEVKATFVSRPMLHLIRWYNKPGDITKACW